MVGVNACNRLTPHSYLWTVILNNKYMILQEDITQTLPMSANQLQMIMDSQENYRKRLLKELESLKIYWISTYKWYDWNYDNLKDYDKKWYLRWIVSKYTYATIKELEDLVANTKIWLESWKRSIEEKPTYDTIKLFSPKFIYTTYYLLLIKVDKEWLSSTYITLFAKECTKDIKQKQTELDKMKSDHYSKYWNWWQRIININL